MATTITYTILCSDPDHASRSAEPDWAASLGTVTLNVGQDPTAALAGYLCPACVRLRAPPAPVFLFRASATIVPVIAPLVILSPDWQLLGGVVANPGFFVADLAKAIGKVVGSATAVGGDAEIRVVEADDVFGDVDLLAFTIVVGGWRNFGELFTQPFRPSRHAYRLEGRLLTALSAEVRFVSIALLERQI